MDGAWDAPGKTRHQRPQRPRGRGQAPAAPRGGGRRPFGSLGSSVSNLMLQPLPETGDGAIAPLRLPAPPLGGRVSLRISESEPGLRFPGNGAGRKSSGASGRRSDSAATHLWPSPSSSKRTRWRGAGVAEGGRWRYHGNSAHFRPPGAVRDPVCDGLQSSRVNKRPSRS